MEKLPVLMQEYYTVQDNAEKKRIREQAKNKFNEIVLNNKKFDLAEQKLKEEADATANAAAAGEEQKKGGMIQEENQNKKQMDKLQGWKEKH